MVSKSGVLAKERDLNHPVDGKVDRRKQVDPTTCERDYRDDEVEFMRAMDDYKRHSGRPFPTWSEVLEVVISLGYRKVEEPSSIDHEKRHNH
ncbi:MAG TPA: hypothetical protein VLA12_18745 [Planctomycetaceae bacterium]|nr:hypothetical protein [Planctomycetaceae bacterium]